MAVPVPDARRRLFDPSFVRFHDGPARIAIVETEPGGAATIEFDVDGPSIAVKGKARENLYWLKAKSCADGAIILWCADSVHVHLVELKQAITAKSWGHATTQFDGMLANVHAVLGAALLPLPTTVTVHIAYAHDRLAASPVLSKVISTADGQRVLTGAAWAAGRVDLLDRPDVSVNKIVWGSGVTAIGRP